MKTSTLPQSIHDASVLDRALRILHLEDDPSDRLLVQEWVRNQNIAAEFTDVDNEADFKQAFDEKRFDIVLSDKSLPDFDGLAALRFVREEHPHIPFVFVTGSMGEEAAIETMKYGATDYVLKDRLSRLIPAIHRAIREAEQEEKNLRVEEKNREQAALLDKAQDVILVTDAQGEILYCNKSAERIYGWEPDAVIGRQAAEVLSSDPVAYEAATGALLKQGIWSGLLAATNRGGNQLITESRWTLVRDEKGNPKSILIIATDITEKKALETKFLRAQRMDSIGALAGGIAHDLNNALAPVLMGTEILRSCDDKEDRNKFLDVVHAGAKRATELVKQILSFARGSGNQRGPVQAAHLIREMGKMIQDTFPKSISFSLSFPGKDLWTVEGDSTELHQVLLNLCVNARDAMPQGGKLALSAQNVVLDESAAVSLGATPGRYVKISVTDTGSGIPPQVLPRIFEPFFTTKKGDKGTGLGLATVSEIVKHHGGCIDIHTATDKGTEFKVYIPASDAAVTGGDEPEERTLPGGRGEVILIVDDEEALLELTKTMLETFGYRVATAKNGLQGVARFKELESEIKLVITDTDMPHMDGVTLISTIQKLKPDSRFILASGSKFEQSKFDGINMGNLTQLGKPFTLEQLLATVDVGLQQ
jgi:PAS domain S-box-containing protein